MVNKNINKWILLILSNNVQTRQLEYMYDFDELFTKIESKRYSLLKNLDDINR